VILECLEKRRNEESKCCEALKNYISILIHIVYEVLFYIVALEHTLENDKLKAKNKVVEDFSALLFNFTNFSPKKTFVKTK
jgi:hypothetical protein